MQLLARIVALAVVAFLFAAPLMACAMETATLVSEKECCEAMAGDCHNQIGPASHKCCRTFSGAPDAATPQKANAVQLEQSAALVTPIVETAVCVATIAETVDTSPPISPPVCSSVLRI